MTAITRHLRLGMGRRTGIALALATAVVSGCSVFVNTYAVKRASDSAAYTTAKNLVAAVLLTAIAAAMMRGGLPAAARRLSGRQAAALALVGTLGGGAAFILFFEGLRRTSAVDAAFIQKSLLIWVTLLAVPLLRERIGAVQVAAVALLLAGQALMLHGAGTPGWRGGADVMILAATLLWSGEVVVARLLLRSLPSQFLGAARMGVGCMVLLAFLAAAGRLAALQSLGSAGWLWALATGVMLTAYVSTWFAALARVPAVDVTAVLVLGAFITALLDTGVRQVSIAPLAPGLALIVAGVLLMMVRSVAAGSPRVGTLHA